MKNCIFGMKTKLKILMRRSLLLFFSSLIFIQCSDAPSKEAIKLGEGIYRKAGWIYDMKELPSGKNVIPFYTVAKLSDNVLINSATKPPTELGISVYFMLDKSGENKNKIVSGFFEASTNQEDLFKFPRCLSVCPMIVEVLNTEGSVTETFRTNYSRPNVFKMDLQDVNLADLAYNQKKFRIRVPISMNNQNTIFEWFTFDFSGFSPNP